MAETRTFWEWDEDGIKRGERSYVSKSDYDGLHSVIDANERALIAASARIRELTEARQHELAYVENVLKACAKATPSDIRDELRDLRAWAANRSTCFPVDASGDAPK